MKSVRKGGKRIPVEGCPGCYTDASGRVSMVVTIRLTGWPKPRNFEKRATPGLGKVELRRERETFRVEKTQELERLALKADAVVVTHAVQATTLRGALPRFLKTAYGITDAEAEDFTPGALPSQRARDQRRHILHWCDANDAPGQLPPFGQRDLNTITTEAIRFILNRLKTVKDGPSEWTLHHRRAALSLLYDTINGKTGYNPVRATTWAQPRDLDDRGFDYVYVEAILKHVPDYKYVKRLHDDGTPAEHGGLSKSKIALRIMCSTGLMCAEQDRIERRHLDLTAGTLVTWRMKAGKVVGERKLDLLPEALDAFRLFDQENMYGDVPAAATVASAFTTALPKAHAEAIEKTGKPLPLPDDVRPTDFRHCFGSYVFDKTKGNEKATGQIMGHADGSRQTARYIRSKVSKVVREATAEVAQHAMFRRPMVTVSK